jgi:hypothetical protein
MPKLAKTARNALIADAALAFARDRIAAQLPGVKPRRRRPGVKALVLGGAALAAGAAVVLKRDKVTALLPSRTSAPAPPEPAYTPPPVSNYDASGPVANTATAVPVPPAYESPALDEAAEEAAAAAEAANIGGAVSDYAGKEYGEVASAADRPLVEAGEGESEGQEQTEAELESAAEPTAPGLSEEQLQIEDAIEAAGNPATGERGEPVAPPESDQGAPDSATASEWQTWSGRTINP